MSQNAAAIIVTLLILSLLIYTVVLNGRIRSLRAKLDKFEAFDRDHDGSPGGSLPGSK